MMWNGPSAEPDFRAGYRIMLAFLLTILFTLGATRAFGHTVDEWVHEHGDAAGHSALDTPPGCYVLPSGCRASVWWSPHFTTICPADLQGVETVDDLVSISTIPWDHRVSIVRPRFVRKCFGDLNLINPEPSNVVWFTDPKVTCAELPGRGWACWCLPATE